MNLISRVLVCALVLAGVAGKAAAEAPGDQIKAAGFSGGLIVVLDENDPGLLSGLKKQGAFLVLGLERDAARVSELRWQVRAAGAYGPVTVDSWDGQTLPLASGTVNAVVCGAAKAGDEMYRILAPLGVVLTKDGKTVFRKPWPRELDEWTHELHDASGNAVSTDAVVAPPHSMQWIAYPSWGKNHEVMPDASAMVSSGGRIFYISQESEPGISPERMPDKWFLVGRDAFNGLELWRIPIKDWGWTAWSGWPFGRNSQPTNIGRRLVCKGDRVYATLGFNAPVSELDAATGKVLRTFAGTEYTDEILEYKDQLVLSVNQGPQAPDKTLASGTRKSGEPPPDAMPPVHKSIMLVDLKTGKTVWKNGDFTGLRSKTGSMDRISHVTLAVGNGQAFLFATRFEIVSLDLRNGTEIWRSKRPEFIEHLMRYNVRLTDRATLVYSNGVLLFGYPDQGTGIIGHKKTPAQIVAYSAKDGALLWQRKMAGWGWAEPPDIYVIDNQVWLHDYDTFSLLALEPKTGKEIRRFSTAAGLDIGHHHRCYRNRSTENYIMTSHRGIEFYNVATGEISKNHWVRGACQFGVIPANGMVYSTPHPCECFIDSKLNGFLALSPREAPKAEGNPLIKGEAYGTVPATAETNYAWPTYRYDKARSGGAVPFAVAAALKPLWTAKMPGKATAAVVADNKVLAISQTDHTVYAFDAASGRKLWEYTLDGPSDVPPTLYKGAALCGSKNGWVYCLRLADGKLAWRLRAAPNERKMVAYGRLESAWPVYGVLINNGLACFAAGRSSFLDGGIYAYAADPATGEIKDRKLLFTAKSEYFGVNNGNGCLADVLLAVGNDVYMRNELVFGKETRDRHVYAKSGLLERSWFNRTDWTFGGRDMGQYFILDSQNVYVLKATERSASSMFSPGSGYLMYAQSIGSKVPAPAIDKPEGEKPAKKKSKEPGDSGVLWKRKVPLRVVAMAKAGDVLFAGGSPDVVNPNDPWGAIEGREGGRLQAISAADGKQLAEYTLGAVPMLDGISLMPGRLFVVLEDGSMVCFGDK